MEKYVYWEKQDADLMCGLHGLNSLLQGPYFDEVSLANLAIELNEREQMLTGKKSVGENLNESGYFSLQAIISALESYGSYSVESVQSKENKNINLRSFNKF